ncbi:putative ABC transporter ATP-binding protein YheS [Poriferisphaera corsica]|uniref:Putative ABC transporter ATP-binding protein YheS n=2 Tax=Poriferisphaera corsica TaxID=2528020 RepID=A0A517YRF4_9BACT|nr:putative ABC transporter ATP-binding protein YheS [Poriferisphaera corsica]
MALISVANVELSFGDRVILDGVNLTLDAGEHVGLVGRNGCGKSTLMKLIAGIGNLKAEKGQIQVARGASVGYLHQDHNLDGEKTLREEAGEAFAHLDEMHAQLENIAHQMADAEGSQLEKLMKQYERVEHNMHTAGGYTVDHIVDEVLHGLGLTDAFFGVKVKDLSGGQRGRLALAKLLLAHPDILLLDEPTNHLDIEGRKWLEEFLSEYNGAVILISHDRWLLNRSVKTIYELELGRMVEYPGSYTKFRELRTERILAQRRAYDKQQTKIKQEKAFIDRYRAGQRSKQAQGREKRLSRYIRDEQLERPAELDVMNLSFKKAKRPGDHIVIAENVSKAYGSKVLFKDVDIKITRGEKIGIIGPNGAGKTTLVKVLLGLLDRDAGIVKNGAQIDVGHFKQTHEDLALNETVVNYLRRHVANETEQEARDLAGAFLFTGNEQDSLLGTCSGGERARVVLAGLVAGGHNVLILDEPTNHLDIPSSERLEESLKQYTKPVNNYTTVGEKPIEGTLILISHDRMLLDNLVDQLLILDGNGNVRQFLGNYSEYAETITREKHQATAKAEAARNEQQRKEAEKRRAEEIRIQQSQKQQPQQQPTQRKNTRFKHMNQQKLEAALEAAEVRLTEIDTLLANPDTYREGDQVTQLTAEREKLQSEYSQIEDEWLSRSN